VKRWLILGFVAVVLATAVIVLQGGPELEYTTNSSNAHALYDEGNLALFAFQWDKAQRSLEKAVELDPDFAMARAALALAYNAWGHADEGAFQALIADSLALQLPDEQERLLVQARVATFHPNPIARQDSLVKLLTEQIPDNLLVLVLRATTAERNGDRVQAEALWRRVLEFNPNFAHAYNTLGYSAAYRGSYDEAVDLLLKYTFLVPDLANPHDSLGEIYTYVGRYADAEQEFRKALALQSDFYPSLVGLATVFLAEGRVDKGLKIMEKTGRLLQGSDIEQRFLFLATRMYQNFWMPEQMNEAASRYIELYPDDNYTSFLRIFVSAANGNLELARAISDSVMTYRRQEIYPRLTEAAKMVYESTGYRFEGLFAYYENDLDAAVTAWQTALTLGSPLAPHELLPIRTAYTRTLSALGQDQEALQQAREILQTNPVVIPALVVQTEALLALNEVEEAHESLLRLEATLVKADPDFPPVARAAELRQEIRRRLDS
jgi:tetratricopeptide (TPR) repeat protein